MAIGQIYRSEKSADGTWTIFDVPVFAAHVDERGGRPVEYDRGFLRRCLAKQQAREAHDSYLPPLHVRHHAMSLLGGGDGVERAGHFRLRRVGKMRYEGKPIDVLFADFVAVPPEAYAQIERGEVPYRSVEINDYRKAEIDSIALLDHEVPYFRFPLLRVAPSQEPVAVAASARRRASAGCLVGTAAEGRHYSALFRFQEDKMTTAAAPEAPTIPSPAAAPTPAAAAPPAAPAPAPVQKAAGGDPLESVRAATGKALEKFTASLEKITAKLEGVAAKVEEIAGELGASDAETPAEDDTGDPVEQPADPPADGASAPPMKAGAEDPAPDPKDDPKKKASLATSLAESRALALGRATDPVTVRRQIVEEQVATLRKKGFTAAEIRTDLEGLVDAVDLSTGRQRARDYGAVLAKYGTQEPPASPRAALPGSAPTQPPVPVEPWLKTYAAKGPEATKRARAIAGMYEAMPRSFKSTITLEAFLETNFDDAGFEMRKTGRADVELDDPKE